jgi:hypothetical protein
VGVLEDDAKLFALLAISAVLLVISVISATCLVFAVFVTALDDLVSLDVPFDDLDA